MVVCACQCVVDWWTYEFEVHVGCASRVRGHDVRGSVWAAFDVNATLRDAKVGKQTLRGSTNQLMTRWQPITHDLVRIRY